MAEKRPEQFRASDFIPFAGYNDYLDRNIPEDLSKQPITLTPLRATSLAAVHYGLYMSGPILLLSAIIERGLEKLI